MINFIHKNLEDKHFSLSRDERIFSHSLLSWNETMNLVSTQTSSRTRWTSPLNSFLRFSQPSSSLPLCTILRHLRFARKNIENILFYLVLSPHSRWGGVFPVFFGLLFLLRQKQKIIFHQPMKNSVSVSVWEMEEKSLSTPTNVDFDGEKLSIWLETFS